MVLLVFGNLLQTPKYLLYVRPRPISMDIKEKGLAGWQPRTQLPAPRFLLTQGIQKGFQALLWYEFEAATPAIKRHKTREGKGDSRELR